MKRTYVLDKELYVDLYYNDLYGLLKIKELFDLKPKLKKINIDWDGYLQEHFSASEQ